MPSSGCHYIVVAGVTPWAIMPSGMASRGMPIRHPDPRGHLIAATNLINARFAEAMQLPLREFGDRLMFVGTFRGASNVPWILLDFLLETWPERYGVVIRGPVVEQWSYPVPGSQMMSLGYRREQILVESSLRWTTYRAASLLWESIIRSWSPKQVFVLRTLRKLGRQKHVAQAMGISPQAVSRTLERAHWPQMRKSLEALGSSLLYYDQEPLSGWRHCSDGSSRIPEPGGGAR